MPLKPSFDDLNAAEAMRKNPNFGHDVLESIINETPELRQALLERGLVQEVKNG